MEMKKKLYVFLLKLYLFIFTLHSQMLRQQIPGDKEAKFT